ncbi:hypothetical protein GQR58_019322 [Nymphon striatum]|nr:hypothetical protein GQR58_019322 [Nymphon striatum]
MTNFSHSFALGPLMPSQDSQVHYMRTSQDIQGQLEITLALVLEIILVVVTLQMKVCGTFLSNVVTTFACDVLTTFYNVLQTFACDVLTTLMTVDAMVDTVKCTEVAAEAAISAALKYAPDRRGGGGRMEYMPLNDGVAVFDLIYNDFIKYSNFEPLRVNYV